jgi:hypothetical protein
MKQKLSPSEPLNQEVDPEAVDMLDLPATKNSLQRCWKKNPSSTPHCNGKPQNLSIFPGSSKTSSAGAAGAADMVPLSQTLS